MQLASKMRFIAAQFTALLTDELWRTNATRANSMAKRLGDGVSQVPGVSLAHPVEANAVFAVLPGEVTTDLQRRLPFYVWDETASVVRWMTSFDTTDEDVDNFIAALGEVIAEHS